MGREILQVSPYLCDLCVTLCFMFHLFCILLLFYIDKALGNIITPLLHRDVSRKKDDILSFDIIKNQIRGLYCASYSKCKIVVCDSNLLTQFSSEIRNILSQ